DWFTDVSRVMGIRFENGHRGKAPLTILDVTGVGGGFIDYDRDGWLDVLAISERSLALYRNERGQRFRDITPSALPQPQSATRNPQAIWMGCAVGDYDNDGWDDIFVSGYRCNTLFHNNGNGTFTDVTARAGVKNTKFWETSAAFVDVDRDGFLDLYVTRYVVFNDKTLQLCKFKGILSSCPPHMYKEEIGSLFRNNRNGTFTDVTQQAGMGDAHGRGLGVVCEDFNNDGWVDIYLANDGRPCDLYRNLGGGRFKNEGMVSGTAFNSQGLLQAGMGCDFGDYDNDGRPDLVVATFYQQGFSLYHNEGNGFFEEKGFETGIYAATFDRLGFGAKFFDYDNDGWLDLMFANGHVQDNIDKIEEATSYFMRPQLFVNRQGTRFEDVSDQAGAFFRGKYVGRGLAVGDYDNDGDLDVLFVDAEGPLRLLRNNIGNRRNWLRVKVEGKQGTTGSGRSNRSGYGTQVKIVANGQTQVRQVRTDGSYLVANDPRVHFGLGNAHVVERVEVRWLSGATSVLENVRANQEIVVRETP
ncbi:MAG: CRTAC1 family protein, partial [Abditibacteriales bacterium]|nr:CRTAC1 family protein [Abditibacteriales bacterium]